jgi:hypothetical protein
LDRWGSHSQDRWPSSNEKTSEGDSQPATQSSQRSQQNSSSQNNQFENILATQRHVEMITYMKHFSKSNSEADSLHTVALSKCNDEIYSLKKHVVELSTSLQELEITRKEEVAAVGNDVLILRRELRDLSVLLLEQQIQTISIEKVRVAHDKAAKGGFSREYDCNPYDGAHQKQNPYEQETEDGMCVADYLYGVQQRNLERSRGLAVSDPSSKRPQIQLPLSVKSPKLATSSNQNHRGEDNGDCDTSHFDDLFQDEPSSFTTQELNLPSKGYRSPFTGYPKENSASHSLLNSRDRGNFDSSNDSSERQMLQHEHHRSKDTRGNIYIYIYVYIYTNIYIYICIYR